MYSGGIAQAVASLAVKSVHRCEVKREYQTWRLQHEAADLISTTSQSGFGAIPEVSQDGRTSSAEELKDAKE